MLNPGLDTPQPPESERPTARGRKSDERREAIMMTATEIINARTYALATMTEIAAALGLRDAALYYYFPSKQALVYACHRRSLERFAAYLDAADRDGCNGLEKLRLLLSAILEDDRRRGPLIYFGDYFHLEPSDREQIAACAAALTERLESFIERGIADGSIVPCETRLVVQLLLGMLIWLAKWTRSVEGLTAERLMAAIDAFSLHGLASRPDSATAP